MLKRIHITGYKSLRDLDVELKPLSILFGPNAAGKSNFLDALQLLSGLATSRTLKDAFEPPYRGTPLESFAFGPEGIKGLLDNESATFSIEVDVELSPAVIETVDKQIAEMKRTKDDSKDSVENGQSFIRNRRLRYRLDIEILPRSGILRVSDEYLTALTPEWKPTTKPSAYLARDGDRIHLKMEGQAHPRYFERYLDHTVLSLPHYPPHYPHLVAMRQELASWIFFYFEPRERMRATGPVKEVRHIGLMGEELGSFLNTLYALDERQFHALEKALSMIVPSITGISVSVNNLGEVELKLLEGTTPIPARVVSEGTLRVLGLLALEGAKDPPALVGFEEPENGIHPRRIRLIAELLKNRDRTSARQMIVTTHSWRRRNSESDPVSAFRQFDFLNLFQHLDTALHLLGFRGFVAKSFNESLNSGDFFSLIVVGVLQQFQPLLFFLPVILDFEPAKARGDRFFIVRILEL